MASVHILLGNVRRRLSISDDHENDRIDAVAWIDSGNMWNGLRLHTASGERVSLDHQTFSVVVWRLGASEVESRRAAGQVEESPAPLVLLAAQASGRAVPTRNVTPIGQMLYQKDDDNKETPHLVEARFGLAADAFRSVWEVCAAGAGNRITATIESPDFRSGAGPGCDWYLEKTPEARITRFDITCWTLKPSDERG